MDQFCHKYCSNSLGDPIIKMQLKQSEGRKYWMIFCHFSIFLAFGPLPGNAGFAVCML